MTSRPNEQRDEVRRCNLASGQAAGAKRRGRPSERSGGGRRRRQAKASVIGICLGAPYLGALSVQTYVS